MSQPKTYREKSRVFFYREFKNIVKLKQGILLSEQSEYQNAHSKLKIKCINNHVFSKSLNDVKKHWCAECKLYINELICKASIEYLLDKPFVKIRPKWLLNTETNYRLELDMYNDDLKMAVEYNGAQHYKLVNFFHTDESKLKEQQHKDALKKDLCIKNNVFLIIVPYTIKSDNICTFIANKLLEKNYEIKDAKTFDPYTIYRFQSRLENIKKIIQEKGGELLEGGYITRYSPVKVKCKNGHVWDTKVAYILRGSWCKECLKKPFKIKPLIKKQITYKLSPEKLKEIKTKSFEKRSETMKNQREECRQTITEKVCGNCEKLKPISEYNNKNDAKDGLQPYCKICVAQIKREWRAKKKIDIMEEKITFNCDKCDKVYTSQDSLTRHSNNKHQEINSRSSRIRT